MSDDPKLDEAIRRWAEQAEAGEHPTTQILLHYHLGELPSEATESLRDHLAGCASCTRKVLDYERFAGGELADEEVELPPGELEAAWERLQERLTAEGGGTASPATVPRSWFVSAAALAALFLVAAVGIGVWALHPGAGLPAGEAVRADLLVEPLTPHGGPARGGTGLRRLALPDWAQRLVVVLAYEGMEQHPAHALALEDAEGRELWRREDVPRSPEGHFTLELPRRLLAPGEYVIVLTGLHDGESTPLARYRFAIPSG